MDEFKTESEFVPVAQSSQTMEKAWLSYAEKGTAEGKSE